MWEGYTKPCLDRLDSGVHMSQKKGDRAESYQGLYRMHRLHLSYSIVGGVLGQKLQRRPFFQLVADVDEAVRKAVRQAARQSVRQAIQNGAPWQDGYDM